MLKFMNVKKHKKWFPEAVGEINSQFNRCPEFNKIDWSESYALFGCSHVFGMSQPLKNTISYKLEQRTGNFCINFGEPGAGPEHHFFTAMRVLKQYKPKRSIFLWSYKTRVLNLSHEEFIDDASVLRKVYRGHKNHQAITHLYNNLHTSTHWVKMDHMYKDTLLMYYPDALIFDIEDVEAKIGGYSNPSIPYDLAPDETHFGPKWNDAFVDMIMEKL